MLFITLTLFLKRNEIRQNERSPQNQKMRVSWIKTNIRSLDGTLWWIWCVLQVSIIPRTHQMLGFAQYMPEERKLHSQDAVSADYNFSSLNFYSCFPEMWSAPNSSFVKDTMLHRYSSVMWFDLVEEIGDLVVAVWAHVHDAWWPHCRKYYIQQCHFWYVYAILLLLLCLFSVLMLFQKGHTPCKNCMPTSHKVPFWRSFERPGLIRSKSGKVSRLNKNWEWKWLLCDC